MRIQFDLTPFVRGPNTGVGQSAWRSFDAVTRNLEKKNEFEIEPVIRRGSAQTNKIRTLKFLERSLGSFSTIYHSFETQMIPVRRSVRVLTVHDLWTLSPNPYQSPHFQKRQAKLFRRALERADFVMTPTQAVSDELIELFPSFRERSAVVPWGPLLEKDEKKREALSHFPELNRPFLLNVGCLETRKDQSRIFRVLRNVSEFDVVVVGNRGFGSQSVVSEMERTRASGTKIWWLPEVTDVELSFLYEKAWGFISLSLAEGFGLPVVEAMALRKPLILSSIPAFREIASGCPVWVMPDDSDSLVKEKVMTTWQNKNFERERMAEASARRSVEFSWDNASQKMIAFYRRIAERHSK